MQLMTTTARRGQPFERHLGSYLAQGDPLVAPPDMPLPPRREAFSRICRPDGAPTAYMRARRVALRCTARRIERVDMMPGLPSRRQGCDGVAIS